MALYFNSVYFSYPSSMHPVLEDITAEFHEGWTGVTGGNGAGKSTFLMLAAGMLAPQSGSIAGGCGRYCSQRTDDIPEGWEDFFFSGDGEAGRLAARLKIDPDWTARWDTLSHGERKRLQLGIALWQETGLLAVDEPTNHLDRDARELIVGALESWEGTGLLVSHDRALLDRLCGNCLFIAAGRAVLRPGGITKGLAEEEREALEAHREKKQLQYERDRLAAEADARRRVVEGSKNRLSKKHVDPRDHDAKGKRYLARLSGKDRIGGDNYRRMKNRVEKLNGIIENTAVAGKGKQGITLAAGAGKMDRICAAPGGNIPLDGAGKRRISFPDLVISPGERIALTGPNGAGKSTLLRFLLERVPPHLPVLYIPQEIGAEEGREALRAVEEEHEKNRGEILSRFSRLGSDPKTLLRSHLPSPGETRKLLIARGVFTNPSFIVMDEPTNHLDLTSIRLLEETLREVSSALLLVSHDDVFLSALTRITWHLDGEGTLEVF
ncbi:MAG: ATP-binding cassette domain-containing protein [Spirochaetaceae bacterium]|jgi:ATPase subunit of ABC transporter with duplicated ATPase domains|nr:ATP-binding cassette domain-containing protein [Spirochaetaceae bacterium]